MTENPDHPRLQEMKQIKARQEHLLQAKEDFEFLISLKTTVAFCDEQIEVYVARNLKKTHQHLDEDEFTAEAAKSLASMNNVFKYNDITPLISEVKAEIFDYDKFRKNYRCCDELVSIIASRAFVPLLNPIAQQLNGGCSSFVVKLTADGNIDYITFQTQTASFYNDISKCKLTFDNVGTTTLPDYVYAEEK